MSRADVAQQIKRAVRAAVYARYSSDMQSPQSADDQIARAKYLAVRGQLKLIKYPFDSHSLEFLPNWIIKDEAESGKVASREGYELIQAGIRSRAFDVLIVDDLSRLTRSLGSQNRLYELLKFHGVELYSICDAISSESQNSKTFFQVKGLVNELSNDLLAMRTKRGQEARVLKGYSSGDICYGYTSRPTQTRMVGGREVPSHYEILVNQDEATTINLIFDLRIKGMGYGAIAKYLNDRGVPSSGRSRKITGQTCNWGPTNIQRILTREKYIGRWTWGKTGLVINPDSQKIVQKPRPSNEWVEHHEGKKIREDLIIVSIEKWDQVQKLIRDSAEECKRMKSKGVSLTGTNQIGPKSDALLAGLLFCGVCGTVMTQVSGTRGGFFGCYMYHRKDKKRCTNNRLLSKKKIEPKIIQVLTEQLLDPNRLQAAADSINEMIRSRLRESPAEITQLEQRHKDVSKELHNLIHYIATNGDVSPTIKDSIGAKEAERQSLETRIRHLRVGAADKLMLTPFALRSEYERLLEHMQSDPVRANSALRRLLRDGLKATPMPRDSGMNCNRYDNFWRVEGTLLVDGIQGAEPNPAGGHHRFHPLVFGGGSPKLVEPQSVTVCREYGVQWRKHEARAF